MLVPTTPAPMMTASHVRAVVTTDLPVRTFPDRLCRAAPHHRAGTPGATCRAADRPCGRPPFGQAECNGGRRRRLSVGVGRRGVEGGGDVRTGPSADRADRKIAV